MLLQIALRSAAPVRRATLVEYQRAREEISTSSTLKFVDKQGALEVRRKAEGTARTLVVWRAGFRYEWRYVTPYGVGGVTESA